MTTITCGGGPTLDQRRGFAGLQDGSHVPGYRGYCPQIKYKVGKTYGQDTHELARTYDHVQPQPPVGTNLPREPLKNDIPESTGDNKYTKNMVPGYTGYVPRRPFKFGGTYKEDTTVCIDEHLSNQKNYANKSTDLLYATRSFQQQKPVDYDPNVRDHLNTYRDARPGRPLLMESKRTGGEPPIPGYNGYMPRIYTTELGLGCRYHQMTKNGLESFLNENGQYRMSQSAPITINRNPNDKGNMTYNRRLYLNDGMIPKYTGFLPQGRFKFGNTYGDTSRSLDVCAHDKTCFGDFSTIKAKQPISSTIC